MMTASASGPEGRYRFSWAPGPNQEEDIAKPSWLSLLSPTSPVTAIGIIGKNSITTGKEELIRSASGRDALSMQYGYQVGTEVTASIFGYHDKKNNRIYLELKHAFDTRTLLKECQAAEETLKKEGFHALLSNLRYTSCRLALVLFHVCHTVILYHPGHTHDLAYVSFFQTLEAVRSRLQSYISDILRKELPESNDWAQQARLGPPRLIFYFARPPSGLRGANGFSEFVMTDGKVSKHPPLKKLELALEDQIYRIYKRTRIITISPPNNLVSISNRDRFVYVENGHQFYGYAKGSAEQMINNFFETLEYPSSTQTIITGPFQPYFSENADPSVRSFNAFLKTHISNSKARSLDGDQRQGVIELCARTWYAFSSHIVSIFFSRIGNQSLIEESDPLRRATNSLASAIERESRFCDQRCEKALPLALAVYKEGAQGHYTKEYHQSKMRSAEIAFRAHARGGKTEAYFKKLLHECTRHWKEGRQMCEELSLTGNNCSIRRHLVIGQRTIPDDLLEDLDAENNREKAIKELRKSLPTLAHHSGLGYLSACNCGKRQFDRDDPFTIAEANYNFYVQAEEECCRDLEKVTMPVFQVKSTSAVWSQNTPAQEDSSIIVAKPASATVNKADQTESMMDLSKATKSLKMTEYDQEKSSPIEEEALLSGSQSNEEHKIGSKGMRRQTSSTLHEPLPHMLTTDSPRGRLPIFPSWSLLQLGSSFVYSHSSGVVQPGFLHGAKHLLCWDIQLKNIDFPLLKEKWPNLAETASKRPNFSPNAKGAALGLTVKVFFGMEYECPQGHRFMASGPDQAMKGVPNSMRGAAAKILSSDMPLYMECPCHSNRPLIAQLMRIHLVTPKAPLKVYLDPRVQPCQEGPTFHPGWTTPHKIPINSCWVLRLPYIYCGEQGAHLAPKELPSSLKVGRLLKGLLTAKEEDTSEEMVHIMRAVSSAAATVVPQYSNNSIALNFGLPNLRK